jgi:hypothetical protein
MVTIERYEGSRKKRWDDFVSQSRNGTFLFFRDYMDYHADRFTDHSLMFFEGNAIIGLLPGNISGTDYFSHGGLTYGGVISGTRMNTLRMVESFQALREYLIRAGIRRLLYKPVPHIYHRAPAEEDLYALFREGALLLKREVSSSIYLPGTRIAGSRLRGSQKAVRDGVEFRETDEVATFLSMVDGRLKEKYGVRAVHTPEEMTLLMSKVPGCIRLFGAFFRDVMIAGAIVYQWRTTAHLQYLSATAEGRERRAADLIVARLATEMYRDFQWFDFGISTEQDGMVLNEPLIKQKEEYGASAICYDTYALELSP